MPWTILTFGKCKGKTLPQIVFADPDWFFWAWENNAFDGHGLKAEATRINERARAIRIPNDGNIVREAEYIIHPSTKNVTDVDFVPKGQPYTGGAGGTIRMAVIDLSVPRSVQTYDKMGGRLVIRAVKPVLFPGVKRLTRQLLEAFFDDDSNFAV
jgi:hypothetical protein